MVVRRSDGKREIIEAVVDGLCLLDHGFVACKILFGILHVSTNLNMKKSCKHNLECMIGSQLDQATLDNLLVPSPNRSSSFYDVNLVLRFVKSFLTGKGGHQIPISRLKKVAILMDSYIVEVAPDPRLKPLKFLALVKALPDSARNSYDGIYTAIDIYLQVHMRPSDEEKMSICHGLNYDKLSLETCNNHTQNERFPSRFATLALKALQIKLENRLRVMNQDKPFIGSPESKDDHGEKGGEQLVLYAEKRDLVSENEKMRRHLRSMQWRVVELEKDCTKLKVQMSNIMKSRLCSKSGARSLPRLCS